MRRSVLALAVFALAGCAGDGGEKTVTVAVPADPPRAGDVGPALRFVNAAAAGASSGWAQSPINTAARFLTIVGTDARSTTLTTPTAETGDGAHVTITQEGLLDDSVRAVRYELDLRRQSDGTWRIRTANRTQRCWPGRGHETFSAALCR